MASTTRFFLPYTPRPDHQVGPVRRRRRASLLGAVAVSFALAVPAAGAAPTSRAADPIAEAQAKRDEIRRQKADLAAQIDLVKASDDEVASALNAIDGNVQAQEAKVNEAKKAIADADRRTAELKAQIEQSQADIAKVQAALRTRALNSYVNPEGAFDSAKFLQSTDLDQAEQRKVLAAAVSGNDRDVIDQLKGAKAHLADLQTEVDAARAEADKRRQDEQAQLDELAAARAEQAKIKAEWDKRLSTLHNDAAELSAADASLSAQIQQAQAEQAAREAAAAQARAAAQSSSSTSSTSGAPGTTGARASGSSSTTAGGSGTTTAPAATQIAPSTGGGYIWPIAGRVSQEFGVNGHPGIDIFAPCGTPTYAARGGTVIVAGMNNGGYGNLVVIDHGGGITTAYAHHASLTVSVGQTVSQGQQVGFEGTTGMSTGCHLHFEVRVNGSVQNPRRYLP